MNISLRKASALQASIQEAMKQISIKFEIDINEFQDPTLELKAANELLFANDARRQRLLMAYYNIRGLVGAANSSGVDLHLTTAAFIDKRIAQLEEIARLQPMISEPVLLGKLSKIRNRKEDTARSIYGRDDTVSTTIVTQEQIDGAKEEIRNLKKQKQKLNDDILELNIKTEIPLSDDVVATLQAEGLI